MLCAIPIEIASRELDGVIYLALHLAKQGLPTLFGERMVNKLVLNNNHPVLYFDIDQHSPTNRRVLEKGGRVFNLNTEGLAFLSNQRFIDVLKHVENDVTRFLLWGDRQKAIVGNHLSRDGKSKLVVTGYPSFDLATEKHVSYYHRSAITELHGTNYILLNTNNGIFNHSMGLDNYLRMIQKMDEWKFYRDEQYQTFIRAQAEYQGEVARHQLELVAHLAEVLPEKHIIVRPHPVENKRFYTNELDKYSNVFVTNAGQVREWIATAEYVIHHDCTTSLEALLMGRPVIQFRPVDDERYNDPMLAGVGMPARTVNDVAQIIDEGMVGVDLRQEQLNRVEPILANVSHSASEVIARLAREAVGDTADSWIPGSVGVWQNILCWRKYVSKLLRARQPGRNGKKVRYALSKFPRLHLSSVQERVDKLCAIEPTLPEVDVTMLAMNTFLMQPRASS